MMKRACGLILAMAMLLCACGPAAAESAATAEFTVQGSAQMMADPDMVSVTANTSVTAGTVGSAQEEMNKIVASATDKLLELGVLDDDIVTTNYSYYPRYNYDTNTITGYEANHTLVITCRDVDMLDGVIGVLTDSGFSQIYSVNYDVSTRGELYQQALEMAIQQAESKAGQMAAASGMTVTGLKSLIGSARQTHLRPLACMATFPSRAAALALRRFEAWHPVLTRVPFRAQAGKGRAAHTDAPSTEYACTIRSLPEFG